MKKDNWGFYAPLWGVFILLIAEYDALFHSYIMEGNSPLIMVGYAFLIFMLVCNYHGKGVRLRYEQSLSISMKIMCADAIAAAFIYKEGKQKEVLYATLLVMVVQITTTWIFNWCCKRYAKHFVWKEKNTLHIYPDDDLEEMKPKIAAAEEVYLCDIPAVYRNDYIKHCLLLNKPVCFDAKLTDVQLRTAVLAEASDTPVFSYERYGMPRYKAGVKRTVDFICALLLLILLSPIWGLCALAIKLCDGGPVYYKQKRCTKDMKEFEIIKFRSMVVHAEEMSGPTIAEAKDPRMTAIGYYLRKFKLDELPQLINILRGDMSFVGPRPERPEIIKETLEVVPEFVFRTKVKAGLTGYAQVHGDYHTELLDKLKWDLMYIENYSLLLDLKIILMTIPTVLRGAGDVKEEKAQK